MRHTSNGKVATARAALVIAVGVGAAALPLEEVRSAQSIDCGSGVLVEYSDSASPVRPLPYELTNYVFDLSEKGRPGPALAVADVVLAMRWLPGTHQSFSDGARGNSDQAAAPAVGTPAEVVCQLATETAKIHAATYGEKLDSNLDALTSYLTAGRYDLASVIYDLTQEYTGADSEEVDAEIGLGQLVFEKVKDRIAGLEPSALNRSGVKINFTDEDRFFEYSHSEINLDVRGIRLLLATDYIYFVQGINWIEDCETVATANSTFCTNLIARVRGELGKSLEPLPDSARSQGASFQLGEALDLLEQRYGRKIQLIMLQEIYNYMHAAALAARSGLAGCVEVDLSSLDVASATGCADRRDVMSSYVSYDALRVLRWLQFVGAHELSHHYLSHSQAMLAELVSELKPWEKWYDWQPDEVDCGAELTLETEADVLATVLYVRANKGKPLLDYFGGELKTPDDLDMFTATDSSVGRRIYSAWYPFFEGYAGLFENDERCGYYKYQSRHVIFQAIYFLSLYIVSLEDG